MTCSVWRQLTDRAEGRLEHLRNFAQEVFDDAGAAERWLNSMNLAIGRGDTPARACATVHGFFEAMAELARIERFRRRESSKRMRLTGAAA